jgi:hypothetical protein
MGRGPPEPTPHGCWPTSSASRRTSMAQRPSSPTASSPSCWRRMSAMSAGADLIAGSASSEVDSRLPLPVLLMLVRHFSTTSRPALRAGNDATEPGAPLTLRHRRRPKQSPATDGVDAVTAPTSKSLGHTRLSLVLLGVARSSHLCRSRLQRKCHACLLHLPETACHR